MTERKTAILAARSAWQSAPAHIRMMAGAYVVPLLGALDAIGNELDSLHHRRGLAVACKKTGCNYPEGDCIGACMKQGENL